jgi:hypothetical protein
MRLSELNACAERPRIKEPNGNRYQTRPIVLPEQAAAWAVTRHYISECSIA